MKKTYLSPAANVIRIEKRLLQSASPQSLDVKSGSVSDTGKLLGRDGIFDEGEE
jgi:hypothetical protein